MQPGYHLGVGGPVYADAREAGCFQAEEAGAVYLAGSFLPRRVSRPKGGIFHGLYHEMPFRCPEIPFLLLVAVIASASDGKNGERIALRTTVIRISCLDTITRFVPSAFSSCARSVAIGTQRSANSNNTIRRIWQEKMFILFLF